MTNSCIICDPPKGLLLKRTDNAVAMFFPHAIKPGHLVIGIRSHIRLLEDAPIAEVNAATILLQKAAKLVKERIKCERFYILSIGDRDLHFHYHLVPKMESEPPLGTFIFSPQGWYGQLPQVAPITPDESFLNELRKVL